MNNTDREHLITDVLNQIASDTTDCIVYFSAIKSSFNKLQQSEVDTISDLMNEISPKFDEFLADEFVEKYHKPQCQAIRKNFDKLKNTIVGANAAYLKPLVNGSGLYDGCGIATGYTIDNYRHLF